MYNPPSFLAAFILALSAAACSGNTLDGGSTADGGSGTAPATTSGGIPATALAGKVNGAPFIPKVVEVRREAGRWFFTVENYETRCGVVPSPESVPAGAKVIITVGDIATRVGSESIREADGHGGTFQTGIFEQGRGEPVINTVTSGTLRFDTWSETPGATITGALKLAGEGSDVAGTFTATMCPPR